MKKFDWNYLRMFIPFIGYRLIPEAMLSSMNPIVIIATNLVFIFNAGTLLLIWILPFLFI